MLGLWLGLGLRLIDLYLNIPDNIVLGLGLGLGLRLIDLYLNIPDNIVLGLGLRLPGNIVYDKLSTC